MTQQLKIDHRTDTAGPAVLPLAGPAGVAETAAGPGPSPFPPGALGVTAEQIAAALQVSLKSVRRLDAERLIPGRFLVGRRVRFKRDLVEKWIGEGCPPPARPRPGPRRHR
jgi:excisionase family DNA binding protein